MDFIKRNWARATRHMFALVIFFQHQSAHPDVLNDFVHFPGLEFLSEHTPASTQTLTLRISQLRTQFEKLLSENKRIVSDGALLVMTALVEKNAQDAQSLFLRYAHTGLPRALQEKLSERDLDLLGTVSGKTFSAPKSQIILHSLWWNHFDGKSCQIAINGVPAEKKLLFHVFQGQPFWIQRICPTPSDNRLAQGTAAFGKETIYVAFQNSAFSNSQVVSNSKNSVSDQEEIPSETQNKTSSVFQPREGIHVLAGIMKGSLGRNSFSLTSSNQHPFVFVGGVEFPAHDKFTLQITASQVSVQQKARQDAQQAPQTPKNKARKNLFLKATTVYRGLPNISEFEVRGVQVSLSPRIGIGLCALVPGTSSLEKAHFLAPHAQAEIELFLAGKKWPIGVSTTSSISAMIPPFSGWSSSFLLGVATREPDSSQGLTP